MRLLGNSLAAEMDCKGLMGNWKTVKTDCKSLLGNLWKRRDCKVIPQRGRVA